MAAAVSLSEIVQVHRETGAQRVSGRWMAAGPDGRLHTFEDEGGVSEVGERIMDLIDGKRSVGEIVTVLCEEFEVDRPTCERDTLAFVSDLVEKRVLEVLK